MERTSLTVSTPALPRFTRTEMMTIRLLALSMLDDDPSELVKRQMQPLLDKTAFLDR